MSKREERRRERRDRVGIRTAISDTIPVKAGEVLAGFNPSRLSPHDRASLRARRLVNALVQRKCFDTQDQHRIGKLPDGRWAVLGVSRGAYVYAWETKGPFLLDHAQREPTFRLLAALPDITDSEVHDQLDEAFKGWKWNSIAQRVQAVAIERDRRSRELDADIYRQLELH